jgi:UDP-glucose 4-epimerase
VNSFFISGATGFIGQRLLVRLKMNGARLRLLSRYSHLEYQTVVCDLQREVIPDGALDGIDTVFHLAGYAHDLQDAASVEHLYRTVNIDATVRLAELAVNAEVERFVFVSSVKAGGRGIGDEPEGVYGLTKREAELKILEVGRKSGMHVSIVRPSLVYGPGVKGNLGLMRSGIKKGWFPPLPETGNHRSMIHVDDLVRALLLVSEDERANGEIFIATDGVMHTSREIYEAICQVVGKSVPGWSVPKFLFDGLSLVSPKIRYKVGKLLGDECYYSEKLEALGFRATKTLLDFDETDF